jgi:chromosome segregation ATPase
MRIAPDHHVQPCAGREPLHFRELHMGTEKAVRRRQGDRAFRQVLRLRQRTERRASHINEEQAKIVRKIYGYFLQGRSPYQIAKLLTVAELIQKCIDGNARVAQDQSEYQKRYDALVQRFETAKAKLDEAQAAIAKTKAQRQMMENFMETLRSLQAQVEIFDEGTWYALCDYITVYSKDDIRVTFQNGTEIPV